MATADNIYVGKDLGWRDIATDEAAVQEYIAVADDANEWYVKSSPFGAHSAGNIRPLPGIQSQSRLVSTSTIRYAVRSWTMAVVPANLRRRGNQEPRLDQRDPEERLTVAHHLRCGRIQRQG